MMWDVQGHQIRNIAFFSTATNMRNTYILAAEQQTKNVGV
jgi:hypothetical protein